MNAVKTVYFPGNIVHCISRIRMRVYTKKGVVHRKYKIKENTKGD